MRLALTLAVLMVFAATAYAPPPPDLREAAVADTTWSWPEQPQNLQVLPDTLGGSALGDVMRGFTRALGVRCHHCHVGEEGQDFLQWDFASDAKPEKETARGMMRMVWQINTEILPAMPAAHEHAAREEHAEEAREMAVSCWTCHRGEAHPASSPPPRERN